MLGDIAPLAAFCCARGIKGTLLLAREMLDLAGLPDADPAAALADGRAMDAWQRMIRAQGGDPDAPLPTSTENEIVRADVTGVVSRMDALSVGVAAWRLGQAIFNDTPLAEAVERFAVYAATAASCSFLRENMRSSFLPKPACEG